MNLFLKWEKIEINFMEYKINLNGTNYNMSSFYFTHDNGGCPFKVGVDDNNVKIYKHRRNVDEKYHSKPILEFVANKIFIGEDPDNSCLKFCSDFDHRGNSILLNIGNNTCVFIGHEIYQFETDKEIISYHSPIGNSDVPYPYAIDVDGNYYLMLDSVVISNSDKLQSRLESYQGDPYYYHYSEENESEVHLFANKQILQKRLDYYCS